MSWSAEGSKSKTKWVWVSLEYATFLLITKDGVVIDAAPIAHWTISKTTKEVVEYYRKKGARLSEENDFPPIQVSTFVKGDQFVFRAASGEELAEKLQGFNAAGVAIMDALADVKQTILAKAVFTGESNGRGATAAASTPAASGARPPAKKAAGRAKDAAPPRGDIEFFTGEDGRQYASLECKHGPMLDLRANNYKKDLYCSLDTKDWKSKCEAVEL